MLSSSQRQQTQIHLNFQRLPALGFAGKITTKKQLQYSYHYSYQILKTSPTHICTHRHIMRSNLYTISCLAFLSWNTFFFMKGTILAQNAYSHSEQILHRKHTTIMQTQYVSLVISFRAKTNNYFFITINYYGNYGCFIHPTVQNPKIFNLLYRK